MEWINSRGIKIYFLAVGAITLLVFLITIGVMLPGYIKYRKSNVSSTLVSNKKIDMSRFLIPESYKHLRDESWQPFRPDKERWTNDDIRPYWQDPEALILEYLGKQNEKLINDLYKDIP